MLRLEVLESGAVGKIELVQSSGHSVLDEAAIRAVQRWRFEPARSGSAAVACSIEVPIRFKLGDADA